MLYSYVMMDSGIKVKKRSCTNDDNNDIVINKYVYANTNNIFSEPDPYLNSNMDRNTKKTNKQSYYDQQYEILRKNL